MCTTIMISHRIPIVFFCNSPLFGGEPMSHFCAQSWHTIKGAFNDAFGISRAEIGGREVLRRQKNIIFLTFLFWSTRIL